MRVLLAESLKKQSLATSYYGLGKQLPALVISALQTYPMLEIASQPTLFL